MGAAGDGAAGEAGRTRRGSLGRGQPWLMAAVRRNPSRLRRRLASAAGSAAVLAALGVGMPGAAAAAGSGGIPPVAPRVGSNWQGLGYNQDPLHVGGLTWSDDSDAFDLLQKRVTYIRPGMVRIMVNRFWFDPEGTEDHQPVQYNWDTKEMTDVHKILDMYRDLKVPVQVGIWGTTQSPAKEDGQDTGQVYTSDAFADAQAALMKHLIIGKKFTNITRYSGINEPNGYSKTKHYSFDDWQTATRNLLDRLPDDDADPYHLKSRVVGPDMAGAGMSAYEGDLGLQSVTPDNSRTAQWLTWKFPADLKSFTARFYVNRIGVTDWSFWSSADGNTWNRVGTNSPLPKTTSIDNTQYPVTTKGTFPADSQQRYIKLVMPARPAGDTIERAIASFEATPAADGAATFVDPMNDLAKVSGSSTGWTPPRGKDNFWLKSMQTNPILVSGSDVHFYDYEVGLKDDPTLDPSYAERTVKTAVDQAHALHPGAPVIFSETGDQKPDVGQGQDPFVFATEYDQGIRMADLAVQETRAGLDGAAAWCLDGYDNDTKCGMWDHRDNDNDYKLRPWFYTWSLLCRYLPAHSIMYAPAPQDNGTTRELDAKLPNGGWTFVLVNRDKTNSAQFTVTEPTGHLQMNKYVYSPTSQKVDANGFPSTVGSPMDVSADSGFKVTVPANSVVMFTSMAP
ncbi:hypothetical protein KRMM14A1259_25300 [Krasilnikovia sp. MM14-A1259]